MSTPLLSPSHQALTTDWIDWLHDLKSMKSSPDVRAAMREAKKIIESRRRSEKKATRFIPVGALAFC